LSWDGLLTGVPAAGSNAAVGTYVGLASIPPPRAAFVDAYRAAFGEEPTDYASAAYACAPLIVAPLEAVATDDPEAADGVGHWAFIKQQDFGHF